MLIIFISFTHHMYYSFDAQGAVFIRYVIEQKDLIFGFYY